MPMICEVSLDKTEGVMVTVTNADGDTVQTIHADGTQILLKVVILDQSPPPKLPNLVI